MVTFMLTFECTYVLPPPKKNNVQNYKCTYMDYGSEGNPISGRDSSQKLKIEKIKIKDNQLYWQCIASVMSFTAR